MLTFERMCVRFSYANSLVCRLWRGWGTFLRRLFGWNSVDPRIGRLARSSYTTRVLAFGPAWCACTPRASAAERPQPVRQLRNRNEPAMETPPRVQIGDRVRSTRYSAGIPAGSIGTVIRTFSLSIYCHVRFDGLHEPQIQHIRDLELMPPSERAPQGRD